MKRIPEVLDCWFESGLMPYAQVHYPFENKEFFEENFPAQFVAEGIDQTRGWFYTLMVLATALFDQPAFLNIIVNGIVLAEDGQKMSKRLKNYPEPIKIIEQYGADAMRLYLLTSPVVRADDLRFSEKGVEEALKKNLIILWNVFSFCKLYSLKRIKEIDEKQYQSLHVLDKWILSKLNSLNKDITEAMEKYDLLPAIKSIEAFIEDLSIWYLRRSRQRFKETRGKGNSFCFSASSFTLSKLIAPFAPFMVNNYMRFKREEGISVHLCDYPIPKEELINEQLEKKWKRCER